MLDRNRPAASVGVFLASRSTSSVPSSQSQLAFQFLYRWRFRSRLPLRCPSLSAEVPVRWLGRVSPGPVVGVSHLTCPPGFGGAFQAKFIYCQMPVAPCRDGRLV